MKRHDQQTRTRFTVDLSNYPDLVIIYLGMRVNELRGLLPALQFGPKLEKAMKEKPVGLLRTNYCFSPFFHSIWAFDSTGAILTAWSVGLAPARTRSGGSYSFKRRTGTGSGTKPIP
jgi:hypothetical protein